MPKSISNREKIEECDLSRELYNTPEHLIESIVCEILKMYPDLKEKVWVDPFADKGQWGRIFDRYGLSYKSYDILPSNGLVEKMDFFDLELNKKYVYYWKLTIFNVEKDCKKASGCRGFLLGIYGYSKYITKLFVFNGFEGNQRDGRSKAVFKDSLGNNVAVWCVGSLYVGLSDFCPDFTKKEIAISPFKSIANSEGVVYIKNKTKTIFQKLWFNGNCMV